MTGADEGHMGQINRSFPVVGVQLGGRGEPSAPSAPSAPGDGLTSGRTLLDVLGSEDAVVEAFVETFNAVEIQPPAPFDPDEAEPPAPSSGPIATSTRSKPRRLRDRAAKTNPDQLELDLFDTHNESHNEEPGEQS